MDKNLVDCNSAIAGDDLGDSVGDVFRAYSLDRLHLALRRPAHVLTEMRDALGVDDARLDDAGPTRAVTQFLP
jgi:hypothetical protein